MEKRATWEQNQKLYPRIKTSEVKRTFQESAQTPLIWNHRQTYPKNYQLDIKLEWFTEEEIYAELKKLKSEKLQAWTKYCLKIGRQENNFATVYKQNSEIDERLHPSLRKASLKSLRTTVITLTAIASKVYNVLIL